MTNLFYDSDLLIVSLNAVLLFNKYGYGLLRDCFDALAALFCAYFSIFTPYFLIRNNHIGIMDLPCCCFNMPGHLN